MEAWAVVTGPTSGIGLELATLLAHEGYNLALVARNTERLERLAKSLEESCHIETKVFALDLAEPASAIAVYSYICDLPVELLVNNAGFGVYGPVIEQDQQIGAAMMRTNMDAVVQLCRLFGAGMAGRGNGRILNVASTAAFQPGPFTALYYASKAFVFSFSVALAEELRGSGVTVTTLCPGMTDTEFFDRAGMPRDTRWPMMSAASVAAAGFRGMMKGKAVVVPGLFNKLTSSISRALPGTWTARMVRRINGK